MKKIIYLCLFALLAVSFGCEKEEILSEQESKSISLEQRNNTDSRLNGDTVANQQIPTTNSTIPLPGGGNDIYNLYLNMDIIENDYNSDPNNPSYNGPFNVFYKDLMSNYFTIYHVIESTNSNCGNVERWIVDLVEFNQHLVSIGLPEVDPNNNDWYDWLNDGNSTGGETTNDTTHNVNGDKQRSRNGIPPPPPPPNTPSWLFNYSYCFSL